MRKRSTIAVLTTASALVASVLAATPSAQASANHPKAIPHTKPAWTAHARHLGRAANSSGVSARVYLAPRGGLDALKQKALAVSTPGRAEYGKFLSTAQYNAQFRPLGATVASVSAFLRSAGLHVTSVGAGNRYLAVKGTVGAAEKAFGAHIGRYQHNGSAVQAPESTLTVPSSIGSAVLTVTGLDTTPKTARPASKQQAPPPAGFRNARPCSLYYGQLKATYQADFKTPLPKFQNQTLSYAPCGYTGPQFRAAYEGGTDLDGSGVTVAITDAYAAPTIKKDANTYAEQNGDGSYAPGQFTQTKASKFTHQALCGPSGWYGEETLDVEAVHAMAPGANIHFYGAASCLDPDLLDTLTQVVDDNEASLVTNSWGDLAQNESADSVAAYEAVFLQGAIQGISFMFSSGDNGDELANSGIKQADYPTSDPYVTSVGGTSTAIGADGSISFETGWGTVKYNLASSGTSWTSVGYLYGAGGGTSTMFERPAYQDGVVTSPYRQDPDVAMDADPNTGMLIGETQTFPDGVYYDQYRIGGTSLASPLFAGMTALSLQQAGHGVGLLNPTIYASQSAFTDVKGNPKEAGDVRVDFANGVDASGGLVYSVRTFNQDSSLKTTKGYDLVTGLGSPNPGWLTAIK
jgi:subtilase family serine protease